MKVETPDGAERGLLFADHTTPCLKNYHHNALMQYEVSVK